MPTHAATLSVRSSGKGTYEITSQIENIITEAGITTGTATVFVQHTSASLVIMENADPSARTDLHTFFDHLVPEDTPYFVHTYEGPDDMPSHIRMALTRTSEVIPVVESQLTLGTVSYTHLRAHET